MTDPLKKPLLPGAGIKVGRSKSFKRKVPSEALESQRLVDYLRARGLKFSHIASESMSRAQGIRNKRMGVVKGVPDYLILLPGVTLWIELKKVKGGRVSPEQTAWIEALNTQPGTFAVVCRGFAEAKKVIEENLSDRT